MNEQAPLTIVATQGYPYTGKTTLVNGLAKRLKFSTLRLDDILDFVIPIDEPLPARQNVEPLKSRAFDLLIQTVKTQISLGLSVIVDSDLSRRSHLQKLTALQTQCLNIRIVLIECNPKTLYTWEMRFNKRDSTYNSKWYKPQNKHMDPEFSRDYTDQDLQVYTKLVVNTTNYVDYDLVSDAVLDLITTTCPTTNTAPWIIHLENWRRQHNYLPLIPDLTRQTKLNKTKKNFCTDGRHYVNKYNEHGIDYYETCTVCEKVIKIGVEAAYTCSLCPLAIHKSCAEAGNKAFLPDNFPKFLKINSGKPEYCFPEEHLCLRCIVEGNNDFTYDCEGCVFQCHLKCGLLPTILYHKGHNGRLFFFMSNENTYMCAACKGLGNYAAYGCVEDCNIIYHPECAMLPLFIEHVHGGYDHGLRLVSCREEELEDYICHLCFQELSPDAWYYNCKSCFQDLHLHCAFQEF